MNTTIKTDEDYAAAIRCLLREVSEWLTPMNVPLTEEAQSRFMHSVFGQVHAIVNSEPHLRGVLLKSLVEMQTLDIEQTRRERDEARKDRDQYLTVCLGLAGALRESKTPPKMATQRKSFLGEFDAIKKRIGL